MASDSIRLDKWLWAARFFKTRALASAAIAGGKVHVNGGRAKPAKPVQVGDTCGARGPLRLDHHRIRGHGTTRFAQGCAAVVR
jgi:ribosomal 50S subunit-recycling heat shock protein